MSTNSIITFFRGFKWRPCLKTATVATAAAPLQLTRSGFLTEVTVAYETYGRLAEGGDNVILVTHALTGDSHPAAHSDKDEKGWWEPLIGSGRPLDTDRYFIVCANVLGGCQGTTGPASPNPATGLPYGSQFPTITIRDMVNVQKLLLDHLGITHLVAVIGGSMGGMQALEWGVTYPDFMDGVVCIAAPGFASAQAIAYNRVGRQSIRLDPAWNHGDYYGTNGPEEGLALARSLGMITYQSEQSMANKFGRSVRNGQFEVENYLEYQGESLVRRFDANSYLTLLKALDLHDLGYGHLSYEMALARIIAKTLVVGVSSDILYPAYQQAELVRDLKNVGVRASYLEIDSPYGHDGFLIDFHLLRPMLKDFLDTVTAPQRFAWAHSFFRASNMAYFGARLVPGG